MSDKEEKPSPGTVVKMPRPGKLSKRAKIVILAIVVILVVGAYPAVQYLHYTEEPEFCATCHEMLPAYESYNAPKGGIVVLHAMENVTCFECHSGSGISGYVGAKFGGMRELIVHNLGWFEEPVKMHAPLPAENCLKCHANITAQKFVTRVKETDVLDPHYNHVVKEGIQCSVCHTVHIAEMTEFRKVPAEKCFNCHNPQNLTEIIKK